MGGQSQQRNGMQKTHSLYSAHKNDGQPQAAAPESRDDCVADGHGDDCGTTSAATPAASAPPAPGAGWLGLGRRVAPVAPCTCGLNPGLLDKRLSVKKRESCHHVMAHVAASECQACNKTPSGGRRSAHHLGCGLSELNGKTHGRIHEEQKA
jgi:hypothetical protein